jgi:hypothetical protein
MLYQDISDFIEALSKLILSELDVDLLRQIKEYFLGKPEVANLVDKELTFLLAIYKMRWDNCRGDREKGDYTLADTEVTREWVNLSKKLGEAVGLCYLSVLFYNLENTKELADLKDLVDGSDLQETKTLTNFYIVELEKKNYLCRKLVLYNWLEKNRYFLSSTRDQKPRVITIKELSTLKRCQSDASKFSVEYSDGRVEYFNNFWDFLTKKSFPNLKLQRQDVPPEFFPWVWKLINSYYRCKEEGVAFTRFQGTVYDFFSRLYANSLADINSLYGEKIFLNSEPHYLLTIFISIFDAQDFTLDSEMESLCIFLYPKHRLKVSSEELIPLYNALDIELWKEEEELMKARAECGRFFVSLFVYDFDLSFGEQHHIDVWDVTNTIPKDLHYSYDLLRRSLRNPEQVNFTQIYEQIRREVRAITREGFFATLFRSKKTTCWLNSVINKQFESVHGYWFPLELIFSAVTFYRFIQNNPVSANATSKKEYEYDSSCDKFLDSLVQSLCNKSELLEEGAELFEKEVRINVLFSSFLSELEARKQGIVLSLIKRFDLQEEQSSFLNNCEDYIDSRLKYLGYRPNTEELFRRPVTPRVDTSIGAENQLANVHALVEEYKIRSLAFVSKDKRLLIQKFLCDLNYPILSWKRIDEINRRVEGHRYDDYEYDYCD